MCRHVISPRGGIGFAESVLEQPLSQFGLTSQTKASSLIKYKRLIDDRVTSLLTDKDVVIKIITLLFGHILGQNRVINYYFEVRVRILRGGTSESLDPSAPRLADLDEFTSLDHVIKKLVSNIGTQKCNFQFILLDLFT